RSMTVFPDPAPPMVSGLVIDGRPFDPSVLLFSAVRVYAPDSRRIRLTSPFAFAVLMAAIRHATSPAAQVKTAAPPGRASPRITTSTIKMIHPARLHRRLLPAAPLRLSIARSSIGSNRMSAGHQYPAQIFSALTGGLNA